MFFFFFSETQESQLSTIIIPVVCSVFAIAIIVWGIGYFVHTRNRYKVEVADFDFQIKSSEYVYRTFFERLRDSFIEGIGLCGSENSNSRLNTSVNNPASYGSIDSATSGNPAPSLSEKSLST